MAEPLKFVALASSQVGPGTILDYVLQKTEAQVSAIYYEEPGRRPPAKPKADALASPSRSQRLRSHLALAPRMPRAYAFRLLKRLSGVGELEALSWCETVHPALLRLACGFAPPEPVHGRRLLRRLDDVARERDIPIIRVPSFNAEETLAKLRDDSPDVVLGLGTRILSAKLLALPRIGVLNGHSSLLPRYRGGTTEFWQLAHGETTTGVTIHWMAPRVDEGAICLQGSWPIPPGFDHRRLRLMSLFRRLDLWREVVDRLIAGEVPRIPQGPDSMPTFRHPSLDQLVAYYRHGRNPLAAADPPNEDPAPASKKAVENETRPAP